jgi:hypothetical protein
MWTFKDKPVDSHDDLLPECTDFVYIITYFNDLKYIGKKAVRAVRKKPPLKGKKRVRRIMTNLPFVNYKGSHEGADSMVPVSKEILFQCSARKAATYLEAELLFENYVLFDDTYINENISGTFFKNSLEGLLEAHYEQLDT